MRYYVGAVLQAAANWEEYIDVTAPKNYKDPTKIAAYIAERKLEIIEGPFTHPLAATVASICILPVNEKGVVDDKKLLKTDGVNSSIRAIDWLLDHSGLRTNSKKLERLFIAGCRIEAVARIMAVEYMVANGSIPYTMHWLLGLDPKVKLNGLPGYMDPARAICGYRGPNIPEIPYDKLAKRFGFDVPNEADAESLALFTYQLCSRLGY